MLRASDEVLNVGCDQFQIITIFQFDLSIFKVGDVKFIGWECPSCPNEADSLHSIRRQTRSRHALAHHLPFRNPGTPVHMGELTD